ncbi:hypothetical protein [Streptomyces sp. NPDC005302]|uniref:hypothetical protein n=1 Tax=Streptomyces sp. NPDC005302 TaxID=3154675 RepID=UPI0033BB142A
MGIFGGRTVDRAASKAYKRGDTVYVATIHAIPGRQDGGLAFGISRVEAAGWKLEQQTEGTRLQMGYAQRYWTCTFRAVPNVPGT